MTEQGFSLGNPAILFGIFNLAAYIVTIAIAFTKLGGRMDVMSSRLKTVEDDLRELAATDRRLSVIEERQTNHARMQTQLMDEIQHLRKGEGFIQSRRSSVDGEYS
jgi:predicted  nucleic acid-binding Zn-ribbon protein